MKRTILALFASSLLFAQDGETTDLFNVNVSVLGIGVQYEKAIGKKFTALATVDYAGGISYTDNFLGGSNTDFIFTTSLALEGRYYYNLETRSLRRKVNTFNSGNYLAIKVGYIPDLFTSKSNNSKDLEPQTTFTFNYGIKRTFATSFFYEFYTGLGITLHKDIVIDVNSYNYETNTYDYVYHKKNVTDKVMSLGFRVGYNF